MLTVDIYKKIRPDTDERSLVNIGRVATAIVVILGVAWIPIMQNISGVLYEYLQSVQSYIAPPIVAVFLLGIFSKRINAKGAMTTLVAGLIIAAIRLVLELGKNSLEPGSVLHTIGTMNFLTFAAWFFLVSNLLAIVVSLLSPAPVEKELEGLTFATLTDEQRASNRNSYTIWDIVASLVVIGIVVFVMVSFNG